MSKALKEVREGARWISGEENSGRGDNLCPGLREDVCLVCEKISKEAKEAGAEGGEVWGMKSEKYRAFHPAGPRGHSKDSSRCSLEQESKATGGFEGGVMSDSSFTRITGHCVES